MRFCSYRIPLKELKSHNERKFVEFMHQYINEQLPKKKGSQNWCIDKLTDEMKVIGHAFPETNYWIYKIDRNKIMLLRASNKEAVLWVSMAE